MKKNKNSFNPSQVGYKPSFIIAVYCTQPSFNPSQVGYKPDIGRRKCLVIVGFNPSQVGYKRGGGRDWTETIAVSIPHR